MTFRIFTDFREIPEKSSETPQCFSRFWFSRFCQIIVTPNIHKTTRLKIIKIIFYQQPKLPSLITKKMMKVFLWRPTWAHFHLELLWQFHIEDSFGHGIWFKTLNYPRFQESCPWVHLPGRSVVSGPTLTHCPSQTPIIFPSLCHFVV